MVEIFFDPTASATAYGQRPKFVRAEHSATAEGESCAYGPTLVNPMISIKLLQPVLTMISKDSLPRRSLMIRLLQECNCDVTQSPFIVLSR